MDFDQLSAMTPEQRATYFDALKDGGESEAAYELECYQRQHWGADAAEPSGVCIACEDVDDKLREINETWAVVRVGGRTRFLHEAPGGGTELYDEKSFSSWFGNWHCVTEDRGKPKRRSIPAEWQAWEYRRQFRSMQFCPSPEGAPVGVYNTFRGFTVSPKKGSWKLLLAHIYRNICQRDATNFRYFIAWMAQLVQEPHIKPGVAIVMKGKEGVGKSKVGEWLVVLCGQHGMSVAAGARLTGNFNAHLEDKLLLKAEEAFWAGDKAAEGVLKDLLTASELAYERKGFDTYKAPNYTRLMISSNESWVVPAASGGRRWFVLEVGDEHAKDRPYFAKIDQEMKNGGLEAMLHDLQETPLPMTVDVGAAPQTPWLVEQRLHSYDNKMRWIRGVLQEGGFAEPMTGEFSALNEDAPTTICRTVIYHSAKQYFAGPKGVAPTSHEIGKFLCKIFGKLSEKRLANEGRPRATVFPPLAEMRKSWLDLTGEAIVMNAATVEFELVETSERSQRG